jgi:hypothetical protein
VAYVTVLDALAADAHAQMVGRSVALAMGGEVPGEFISWDMVRTAFDEYLLAPPEDSEPADDDRSVIMRGLGLR